MAISGVGKIADTGLLARTLSHLSTVNKTAQTPPVKETTQPKRVNEGETATRQASAIARQVPATIEQAGQPKPAVAVAAKSADNEALEAPAKLDIKA